MKTTVVNITRPIILWFLRVICRFFLRVKVHGIEKIPDRGTKKLYISNHISLLDGVIIGLFLPDMPYFVMAKSMATVLSFSFSFKYFINLSTRILLSYVNVFLVDTKSPHAIKEIISIINDGKPVLIFPEGKITTDGQLNPAAPGTAMIIEKTNAQIIPIHLTELEESYFSYLKGKVKQKLFGHVDMYVFLPINYGVNSFQKGKEYRKWLTNQIDTVLSNNKYVVENDYYH